MALGPPAGWPKAVVPILSLLSLVSRYSPKQFRYGVSGNHIKLKTSGAGSRSGERP